MARSAFGGCASWKDLGSASCKSTLGNKKPATNGGSCSSETLDRSKAHNLKPNRNMSGETPYRKGGVISWGPGWQCNVKRGFDLLMQPLVLRQVVAC